MSQFGDRLRELRQSSGLTQEQLARRADVTSNTVVRIENGVVGPRWDTVLKLAKALDVPVTELASTSGEENGDDEPAAQPA